MKFSDASAIKAEGPGIKDAVSGQKTHFVISTLDAGSGTKQKLKLKKNVITMLIFFISNIKVIYLSQLMGPPKYRWTVQRLMMATKQGFFNQKISKRLKIKQFFFF